MGPHSRGDAERRAASGPESRPATLYQLGHERRMLMEAIASQDGEITPEQEAELDRLEPRIAGKVDAFCAIRQERLLTAAAIDAEIVRLIGRKQVVLNDAERLKARVRDYLDRSGETAVKTALFSTRIQASPPKARWTRDLDQLPGGFLRLIPGVVEFDRDAALKAYREGRTLPEGIEISQGTHLVIS